MNPQDSQNLPSTDINRRRAIQWMLGAVAATSALAKQPGQSSLISEYTPTPKGYGTDAILNKAYAPGDFWPLTFTEPQRNSVAIIADIIFPADETGPSASSLKIQDFVDEWVSAPYPAQAADRQPILDCVAWFEAEAERRFQTPLSKLSEEQRHLICDDVAFGVKSKEFQKAVHDFGRFKYVVAGGYYSTPAGWKDIGYVGNTPSATYEGPTLDALKHVGLA